MLTLAVYLGREHDLIVIRPDGYELNSTYIHTYVAFVYDEVIVTPNRLPAL